MTHCKDGHSEIYYDETVGGCPVCLSMRVKDVCDKAEKHHNKVFNDAENLIGELDSLQPQIQQAKKIIRKFKGETYYDEDGKKE